MNLPNLYESKNYKKLLIVPALLLVIALGLILFNGVQQGVDLKGGVLLTIQTTGAVDVNALRAGVSRVAEISSIRSFASPSGTGVEIELETSEKLTTLENRVRALQTKGTQLHELQVNETVAVESELTEISQKETALNAEILVEAKAILNELGATYDGNDGQAAINEVVKSYGNAQDDYRKEIVSAVESQVSVTAHSFREVGPSLSKFFLEKAREILLFSFLLAGIAVFVVFRAIAPSVVVILGAVIDIVVTLGAMSLFGIPLSLASIAGLLMLIGFSLDTDVMLTMRVLKRREDTPAQRAFSAFKTGAMMNLTTIGAFSMLALAGLYLQIPTYFEIGIVAVIGGVVDFAATWGANAVLILMYTERKESST